MSDEITMESVHNLDIGEFKPFAYYDQFMDCIRVYTHDRSVTEVRLDDFVTIYRGNHYTGFGPKYVGFALKGVKHILDEIGLSMDGAYTLAFLFDEIVKKRPSMVNQGILELTMEHNTGSVDLTVDFSDNSTSRAA